MTPVKSRVAFDLDPGAPARPVARPSRRLATIPFKPSRQTASKKTRPDPTIPSENTNPGLVQAQTTICSRCRRARKGRAKSDSNRVKQVEDHVGGRDLTVQTVRWTGRRASGVAAVYPSLLTERMKKEMEMAATPSPKEGPPNPPDTGNPPA